MVTAAVPNRFESCNRSELPAVLVCTVCLSVVAAANDPPDCGEVPHVAVHPAVEMALPWEPIVSVSPCGSLPMSAVHPAMAAVPPRIAPATAVREPIH